MNAPIATILQPMEATPATRRQSRLGIASSMIGGGLPLIVTLLLMLSVSFHHSAHGPSREHDKALSETFSVAFFIVALPAPLLHLAGLILGLIGVRTKETKKLASIVGIILNLFFLLIGVGIICLLLTDTSWAAFR